MPAVSFQLDRFIPISRLKYYFAVDTVYVGKKLGLLVFPYMHEVCLMHAACWDAARGNDSHVRCWLTFELQLQK